MEIVPRCRSCGAEIRWARTSAGKRMPLDAEPNPNGNVELTNGVAVVHAQPPAFVDGEIFMPHFATCPDPQWEDR